MALLATSQEDMLYLGALVHILFFFLPVLQR